MLRGTAPKVVHGVWLSCGSFLRLVFPSGRSEVELILRGTKIKDERYHSIGSCLFVLDSPKFSWTCVVSLLCGYRNFGLP